MANLRKQVDVDKASRRSPERSTRTNDPALTLDWLREPRMPSPPKRFIVSRGRVRYMQWMQTSKTHRRRSYLVDAVCEIDGCEMAQGQAVLVFDHCHRHGWIRAVLCNAHNVRLGALEAVWLEHDLDLRVTPYWKILMSCEDCRIEKEPPGFCRKGHERSGDNVRITVRPDGVYQRRCRTCDLAYKEAWRRARGAAKRGSREEYIKRYKREGAKWLT